MSFRIEDILKDTKKQSDRDNVKTIEDTKRKYSHQENTILEQTLLNNPNYNINHRHHEIKSLLHNNNVININNDNVSDFANKYFCDYPKLERNYYALDSYIPKGMSAIIFN